MRFRLRGGLKNKFMDGFYKNVGNRVKGKVAYPKAPSAAVAYLISPPLFSITFFHHRRRADLTIGLPQAGLFPGRRNRLNGTQPHTLNDRSWPVSAPNSHHTRHKSLLRSSVHPLNKIPRHRFSKRTNGHSIVGYALPAPIHFSLNLCELALIGID